jgi:hypothetical protein
MVGDRPARWGYAGDPVGSPRGVRTLWSGPGQGGAGIDAGPKTSGYTFFQSPNFCARATIFPNASLSVI